MSCLVKKENLVESIIRMICYITFPMILLLTLTVGGSLLTYGTLVTDVNQALTLRQVAVIFSMPMLVALAAVPLCFKTIWQKVTLQELGFRRPTRFGYLFCAVCTGIVAASTAAMAGNPNIGIPVSVICFQFFAVAISEEIMLRGVLMDELGKLVSSQRLCCVINAAIFAFIYHSSEPILPNLLIRFPLGLALCYSRVKSGEIYSPIMLHWAYNMFISTL